MMFTEERPKTGTKNGEIRYWAFRDAVGRFYLEKVRCLRRSWDSENEMFIYNCELQEPVSNLRLGMKPGFKVTIDYTWQLQKTLEDARRLLVVGVLRGADFLLSVPPWEQ